MSQLAFKFSSYKVDIDLTSVVDPAEVFTVSVTLADGTDLLVNVAAEASRTAAGLADAIVTAIPEKLAPHRAPSVTSQVSFVSLGAKKPTSVSTTVTATVLEEADATLGIGAAGLLGYIIGR